MGENLAQLLEPIASQFRALNVPEPLTHWGHPFFMSIVMFAMGGYGAYADPWQGLQVALQQVGNHGFLAGCGWLSGGVADQQRPGHDHLL